MLFEEFNIIITIYFSNINVYFSFLIIDLRSISASKTIDYKEIITKKRLNKENKN